MVILYGSNSKTPGNNSSRQKPLENMPQSQKGYLRKKLCVYCIISPGFVTNPSVKLGDIVSRFFSHKDATSTVRRKLSNQ